MKSYKDLTDKELINQILQLFSCTSYEEMESITDDPADLEIIIELKRVSQDEDFIPCIKIIVIKSNEMEGI